MAIYSSIVVLLVMVATAFGQAYSSAWSVVVAHTNDTTGFITPTNLNTFMTNVALKAAADVGAASTNTFIARAAGSGSNLTLYPVTGGGTGLTVKTNTFVEGSVQASNLATLASGGVWWTTNNVPTWQLSAANGTAPLVLKDGNSNTVLSVGHDGDWSMGTNGTLVVSSTNVSAAWNSRLSGNGGGLTNIQGSNLVGTIEATVANWSDTAAHIDTNTLPLGVAAWPYDAGMLRMGNGSMTGGVPVGVRYWDTSTNTLYGGGRKGEIAIARNTNGLKPQVYVNIDDGTNWVPLFEVAPNGLSATNIYVGTVRSPDPAYMNASFSCYGSEDNASFSFGAGSSNLTSLEVDVMEIPEVYTGSTISLLARCSPYSTAWFTLTADNTARFGTAAYEGNFTYVGETSHHYVTNTYFHEEVEFDSNLVVVASMKYATNKALNGATLNISQPHQYTNAAGAITYTGLANTDLTRYQETELIINANGGDRLVTIPASWKNHDVATTFTVTNGWYATLKVWKYGNMATGAVWSLIK